MRAYEDLGENLETSGSEGRSSGSPAAAVGGVCTAQAERLGLLGVQVDGHAVDDPATAVAPHRLVLHQHTLGLVDA